MNKYCVVSSARYFLLFVAVVLLGELSIVYCTNITVYEMYFNGLAYHFGTYDVMHNLWLAGERTYDIHTS